jgi:diguanylate cyclase (GGDEF)-like protein
MFQMKKSRKRYTIGLLAGWPVYGSYAADRFVDYIAQGLQQLAEENDCNLLLGLGVNRLIGERSAHAAWPLFSPESDFVPVGPWNTDGLIVLSPVRSQVRTQFLRDHIATGFPVVFIGHGAGGPAVMVDNASGIRQALAHLVEHGHRRIAFLAGDTNDPGDSLLRLNAYHNAVREFQLDTDPALVTYGYHNQEDGFRAVTRMLGSGVEFSALLASNDMSAIGAMQAIRESGRRVPQDIAVIGFDDQPMAAGQDPPLASIHYPLFEAGYQAGSLLFEAIKSGKDIGKTELLLTPRLVSRRSCGCSAGKDQLSRIRLPNPRSETGLQKESAVQQMLQIICEQVNSMQPEQVGQLCEQLTGAFLEARQQKSADLFHDVLTEILATVKNAGENLHTWQEAITILSSLARQSSQSPEDDEFANILLHRARVEISETIHHQQEQALISQNSITHQLSWLAAYLFAAENESEIVRALARLPLIGIKFVHVGFFQDQDGDPVAGVRYCIPGTEQVVTEGFRATDRVLNFQSREFPPPSVFPDERPYHLALLPLVFQDDPIGFVVFESNNLELYAAIVRELAAAIKSAELHVRVLELSQTDGLTKIFNRRYFEEYLDKELERSRRYSRPLALLMLDLDHFKDYNDTFGHQAGDRALQKFAGIIRNEVRHNLDIVARYGGEEFVVVMPESDLNGALKLAERIRATFESADGLEERLTTSIGVAACTPNETGCDLLINQADKALYAAKHNGRNQVCVYHPE